MYLEMLFISKRQTSISWEAVHFRIPELSNFSKSSLGHDKRACSLHSFRAGGATEIVKNFPHMKSRERLLKRHGRWKSDIAKDMYVLEDTKDKIAVSKAIGIFIIIFVQIFV